jgi:hypothetical protein
MEEACIIDLELEHLRKMLRQALQDKGTVKEYRLQGAYNCLQQDPDALDEVSRCPLTQFSATGK